MNMQTRRNAARRLVRAFVPFAAAMLAAGCHSGGGVSPGQGTAAAAPAVADPRMQQFEAQRNAAMEFDAKRRAAAMAAAAPPQAH
jgi:hypothetical protein